MNLEVARVEQNSSGEHKNKMDKRGQKKKTFWNYYNHVTFYYKLNRKSWDFFSVRTAIYYQSVQNNQQRLPRTKEGTKKAKALTGSVSGVWREVTWMETQLCHSFLMSRERVFLRLSSLPFHHVQFVWETGKETGIWKEGILRMGRLCRRVPHFKYTYNTGSRNWGRLPGQDFSLWIIGEGVSVGGLEEMGLHGIKIRASTKKRVASGCL